EASRAPRTATAGPAVWIGEPGSGHLTPARARMRRESPSDRSPTPPHRDAGPLPEGNLAKIRVEGKTRAFCRIRSQRQTSRGTAKSKGSNQGLVKLGTTGPCAKDGRSQLP